jgi:uncharacterized protein
MPSQSFSEQYGPWAIVTGASSGIGLEFARQLAAKGLNLLLIARRKELMEHLATELTVQFPIECRILELDLTREDILEQVVLAVEGLDIGLLVNNAGVNCEGHFYRGDMARNRQMMKLNMDAPFMLAYHFGQQFMEKSRGGIIFTASTSAFQATPYLSHYGATKAYLLSLAESMNYEFKDKGVDVLAICPGPTESEMTKGVKNNPIMMKADVVVKQALNGLGKEVFVVPGFFNKTMVWLGKRVLTRTGARDLTGAVTKRFLPGVKPRSNRK